MGQTIELNGFDFEDLFCMLCGEQILYGDGADPNPCKHVIFGATSDGYFWVAESMEGSLPSDGPDSDDFIEELRNLDIFASGGVFIETYGPAPQFFGTYIGLSFSET